MKRYRLFPSDFDSRAHFLKIKTKKDDGEKVKKQQSKNKKEIEKGLIQQYGVLSKNKKKQNFIDLESKPMSVLAFHNKFFEQIRTSFIMGAYYPALTGACALGERILNHLIIKLRDYFKGEPEYKHVYNKKSFDNWSLVIKILKKWKILLPKVAKKFKELEKIRHKAIHFRPEVDQNDRELALNAIHCLQEIIKNQFSGWGSQPWFITSIPGEIYIKKEWENNPFIKKIYLPNCLLVGPKHIVQKVIPKIKVKDSFSYSNKKVSDEEFSNLRKQNRDS